MVGVVPFNGNSVEVGVRKDWYSDDFFSNHTSSSDSTAYVITQCSQSHYCTVGEGIPLGSMLLVESRRSSWSSWYWRDHESSILPRGGLGCSSVSFNPSSFDTSLYTDDEYRQWWDIPERSWYIWVVWWSAIHFWSLLPLCWWDESLSPEAVTKADTSILDAIWD